MGTYETEDGEYFSAQSRSSSAPLREPTENDPYVDTLHDKYPSKGGRVELTVQYEASNPVKIEWKRTGSYGVYGSGFPRNGKTSMVIVSANYHEHNNRKYTVVITDTTRNRSCSTSASVYVGY